MGPLLFISETFCSSPVLYNLTKKFLQFPGLTSIISMIGIQTKTRTSGNNQSEEGKVTL